MKKRITTLVFVVMSAMYANAQITLDEANVPHSTTYTENRDYVFNDIAVPSEGANQTYDYSDMSLPTSTIVLEYLPVTRPEFANSSRYFVGSTGLGPISLNAEYYTLKDANGIYETGSYTLPQTSSLQALTGNANDFIEFPGNTSLFPAPADELSFPHTFGTSSTSNYQFTTEFELTVAGFNLAATPGENIQSVVKTVETVGYGQLILPMPEGQSIPYDVLLVKEVRNLTNTINLGGAPAPDALLAAFGLTQGQTEIVSNYLFYTENYEEPIAHFIMNEDFTEVNQMFYDMDLLELEDLSVAENEFSNSISMYPNPAADKLTIAQESGMVSDNQIAIYDIFGKLIKRVNPTLNNTSSGVEIDVNALANGTYLVRISSDIYSATKKLIINR